MRLDKMAKQVIDARNLRLKDPRVQARLDGERQRTKEAWGDLGNQALDSATRIIWNSTGRLFMQEKTGKGKNAKYEHNPTNQVTSGAEDSTYALMQLVGKILKASGRTTLYGFRRLTTL